MALLSEHLRVGVLKRFWIKVAYDWSNKTCYRSLANKLWNKTFLNERDSRYLILLINASMLVPDYEVRQGGRHRLWELI